jgi:hypothetical protein
MAGHGSWVRCEAVMQTPIYLIPKSEFQGYAHWAFETGGCLNLSMPAAWVSLPEQGTRRFTSIGKEATARYPSCIADVHVRRHAAETYDTCTSPGCGWCYTNHVPVKGFYEVAPCPGRQRRETMRVSGITWCQICGWLKSSASRLEAWNIGGPSHSQRKDSRLTLITSAWLRAVNKMGPLTGLIFQNPCATSSTIR